MAFGSRLPSVRVWIALYVVTGLVAGLASDLAGASQNLSVYRSAALALLEGAPLYERFSWDYDFYKYGPAFAFAFVPLALLPWHVSALLWSGGNFALGAYGMARLARSTWASCDAGEREARARLLLALSWPGIVLTTDGDQSNLLVAGACLWACACYFEQRERAAAPLLAFAILVKLFPAALGAVALTSRRVARAVLWLVGVTATFALSPLLVVGPARLWRYHLEWRGMVIGDRGAEQAPWSHWSVMHALEACGVHGMDWLAQMVGALVFFAGVGGYVWHARRAESESAARHLGFVFVASTLAFVLLFNHRSESPTYVLSGIAAAMYLLSVSERRAWHWALFVLAVLAPSPLYSEYKAPGLLGMLAAKRLFHPLRLLPLGVMWVLLTSMLIAPRRGTLGGDGLSRRP